MTGRGYGGAYDHAYRKVEEVAQRIPDECNGEYQHAAPPGDRREFKRLLMRCAMALRAIEWNDSGDGDPLERGLVSECLGRAKDRSVSLEALGRKIDNGPVG